MTYILKLNLYTVLNPTQKITLLTKLIVKVKTLNCNMNTFTKMTKNNKMNTIVFTYVTINIQSEWKATSDTKDHFNTETTNHLSTINKITNIINDHNH